MEIVFKNPLMFFLVLLIPPMIILHYYFFEHNRRRGMKFANFVALKRVTGTHLITKNTSQLMVRILVVSFMILGAAGPTLWYSGRASITDYVIAIDSSASMVTDDVLPDRLTVAKQSANTFIDSLDAETKVGIVTFSGISFIKSALTKDLTKVKNELSQIDIQLSGGTDIGGALVTATNLLSPGEKSRTIILISDGSETAGSFVSDSLEAGLEYVKTNQVIVHAIGIGTKAGKAGYTGDTNLKPVYDKSALQKIADDTGGKFFEVRSTAEAAAAFISIGNESHQAEVSYEATGLFMALSFITLFIEWGLLNTKFRALP